MPRDPHLPGTFSPKGPTASKEMPGGENRHSKYDPRGRGTARDCPLSQATTILESAVLSSEGGTELGLLTAYVPSWEGREGHKTLTSVSSYSLPILSALLP